MAPPNRPPPREFEVVAKQQLTPNMLRITLGGVGIDGFPQGQDGGYLKLRLQQADGKTAIRTYTIRAQRPDGLDIDFALHAETATGHAGPATEWALSVQIGDIIEAGGPGPAKPLPYGHDFYLLAGDMTALPAISVNLAALPANARGLAVIEVMHEDDRVDLHRPDGVELHWVITAQPGSDPDGLANALRSIPWPSGETYAWCACEFGAMQKLRAYLRDEHGFGTDQLYISSYWKSGLTEEDHKRIKREDAEAQ